MKVLFSKRAKDDYEKLKQGDSAVFKKALKLLKIISKNPHQNPPSFEKLSGDLKGAYSRRLNKQHRLVYRVFEDLEEVWVISMWSHYE